MSRQNEPISMINMFTHPVFCVCNGLITQANHAAIQHHIEIGMSASDLLLTGKEEYQQYRGGYLSLCMSIDGIRYIAAIVRSNEGDIFHLQPEQAEADLRAMSLVTQQLRGPLTSAMTVADRLFPNEQLKDNSSAQQQISQMNRSLYQVLRMLNNMSDISVYNKLTANDLSVRNITSIFAEIMENMTALISHTGKILVYHGPNESLYTLVDEQMLRRAVHHLISNAVKFSPANSTISVKLKHSANKIYLSVENETSIHSSQLFSSIFSRFLREPCIEDGRHGIGLGIPIVQNIAAAHGGALLVDQSAENSIRFTMSILLRRSKDTTVKTVKILPSGYDEALIALSDILPYELYQNIN